MGQRELWCLSLFMPALLFVAVSLLPSLNPLIRPFALAACNGFIRRYYQEGPVLPCLHPDGHNAGRRGKEEGGEGKLAFGEEVDQTLGEET